MLRSFDNNECTNAMVVQTRIVSRVLLRIGEEFKHHHLKSCLICPSSAMATNLLPPEQASTQGRDQGCHRAAAQALHPGHYRLRHRLSVSRHPVPLHQSYAWCFR